MAPALCLPLPPVLARCCALHLFEDARKVIGIAHAAFLCDNLNVFIAESQQALCLRDAQLHPENYKDLLVRVAGYSTQFVNLSKSMQDAIIARTEHAAF